MKKLFTLLTALLFAGQALGNGYYTHGTFPVQGSAATSAGMRAEFDAVMAGFDKLPTLTANGLKIIAVNSGATALEAITTTGTGSGVRATSPTFTTPILGVAAATSINKVAITAPATSATLTIADGKTLTSSNTLTLTATDGSTLAIGTGGTLGTAAYTAATDYATAAQVHYVGTTSIAANRASASQALTGITSIDGNAATATTATNLAGGSGGTLPHQTAAGTTAMLANGTAGQWLKANGTTVAPSWADQSTLVAGSASAVAVGGITGLGTGVATALAVNTGTAGAFQVNNGSGAGLTSVNATTLGGATFAAPGAIGGGTPGSVAATTMSASGDAALNGANLTTTATTVTAFAGATVALNIGGTGATSTVALPGTLEATSSTAASLKTAGGLGVAKAIIGGSTIKATTGIAVGGATPGTGGIAFPATQVAVADANTLDDYEEGSWTAACIGDSTAGVGTYGAQDGRYTKIGRTITISGYFALNSHTGSGNLLLSGFPFASGSGYNSGSIGYLDSLALTALNVPTIVMDASVSTAKMFQFPVGGGSTTQIPLDTAFTIQFTLTYFQ